MVVVPGVAVVVVGDDMVVLVDPVVVTVVIIAVTVVLVETFTESVSVLFEEICSPVVLFTDDSSSPLLRIGKIFSLSITS